MIADIFLENITAQFQAQKHLAERAVDQVSDADLHRALDEHTNCIAVIMKHMAGNMRSRWTDFLTTDGEKPDRHRDNEFLDDFESRAALQDYWQGGWDCLLAAIAALRPGDLTRTITIRGHEHSVVGAIHRQVDHYGYHVGQIVQLARHWAGDHWTTLTVPRGGSAAFNRRIWKQEWT